MAKSRAVLGEGERLQRERERQLLTVKGSLFLLGMLSGGLIGYFIVSDDFGFDGPWPPTVAISLAVIYVLAIAIGSVLLKNRIDEVERMQTYKAVTVAGTSYMIVYPVWFLLWKGSMVPEPIHWLLFIGFWALLIGSALYYRIR